MGVWWIVFSNPATEGTAVSEHDSPTQSVSEKPSGLTHIQVDLRILYSDDLSPTAKLAYGRLALYAGKNGRCTPSHDTMASQVRVSTSRIRAVLKELRDCGLIDWKQTGSACSYTVFGPECLKTSSQSVCLQAVGVSVKCQQKEVENRGSGKDVRDIDGPFSEKRKSPASSPPKSKPIQYPKVSKMLAMYRAGGNPPKKQDYPSDAMTAEIVHAAKFREEQWILDELVHLHNVRDLRWGSQNGPKSFKWFITVIEERAGIATTREDARIDRWDHDGTRKAS